MVEFHSKRAKLIVNIYIIYKQKLQRLSGPIFMLTDFPAKGFCLKLSSFSKENIYGLISWAYFVLNHLQSSCIAHNVYITRAKENFDSDNHDDIRIYIWARKDSSRVKSAYGFIPAASTLFGHVSMESKPNVDDIMKVFESTDKYVLFLLLDAEKYEDLTEDKVAEILNDITSDNFYAVRDSISAMNLG